MNEWRTIHISERCIGSPPALMISLSRNERVEKHQQVPLRLWSLTGVVGRIFTSVKAYPEALLSGVCAAAVRARQSAKGGKRERFS